MEVTGWTYWDDPDYIDVRKEYTEKKGLYIGGFSLNLSDLKGLSDEEQTKKIAEFNKERKEKLERFENENPFYDKFFNEAYKAVIENLRKNNYHFSGAYHQEGDYGCPIIDNRYISCYSMREWGNIMAEAYPEEIGDFSGFEYVLWAWRAPEGVEEILPKENN